MNLLVLSPCEFPDKFPWDSVSKVFVVDGIDYSEDDAAIIPTALVTSDVESVPEDLLNSLAEIVEDEDPLNFVISRGMPGDLAALVWDDTDETYEILERLNKAGVTVMDPSDTWVEIVIDKTLDFENLINVVVERVTADVLRAVRAELDTPGRRARFRSQTRRA